eukprot:TRINITY_DN105526_c0_g1_i1.p1 TRINITY_DN105526_c0_g1~~TRINITY_DN105526_c0_g1_i1.p1  ORF type:complete len:627 (+),score=139.00 TRINITY_DN105526_c0_g1_i1:67-1947(+)
MQAQPKKDNSSAKKQKQMQMLPAVSERKGIGNWKSPSPAAPDQVVDPKARAKEIVNSLYFDLGIGFVILLSAACIGVELQLDIEGKSTLGCKIFESFALVVYIFEIAARFNAYGCPIFRDDWVKFDLFLVVLGIVTSWIIDPITAIAGDIGAEALGPIMLLRTARLLRLAKTARIFSRIKEFWFLVRGFLNCASIVVYTFIVFFICIYMFACLGLELITKHPLVLEDPDGFGRHVDRYFSSLPKVLLTLVRFACLDNTAEVYTVLVESDPWLAIYFVAVILTISLILFHLLGAVVFSSTLDQNQKEVDDNQKQVEESLTSLIGNLRDMFLRLDEDQSGQVSKDEILNINPRDLKILSNSLGVTKPMQVFNALDVDGSGEISIDEFFDGILDVAIARTTVDQKRIEKQVETLHWRVKEMFNSQHEIKCQLQRLSQDLVAVTGGTAADSRRVSMSKQGSNESFSRLLNSRDAKPPGGKGEKPSSTTSTADNLPPWAQELSDQLRQSFQMCMNICDRQVKSAVNFNQTELREVSAKAKAAARRASTFGQGLSEFRQTSKEDVPEQSRPPSNSRASRTVSKDGDSAVATRRSVLQVNSPPRSPRQAAKISPEKAASQEEEESDARDMVEL